jgi:ribosomal protein L1
VTDFDTAIHAGLMGQVGRSQGCWCPRGLMPNPKLGTCAFDVAGRSRSEVGKVEFVSTRREHPHAVGKKSFSRGEHPRRTRDGRDSEAIVRA